MGRNVGSGLLFLHKMSAILMNSTIFREALNFSPFSGGVLLGRCCKNIY